MTENLTIKQKITLIKDDLDFFENELDKYEYIIDLGKKLEPFDDENKTSSNIVHGCTSQVWLTCQKEEDKLIFKGTSETVIVRGLVYLILEIFSNNTIEELQDVEMDLVYELGLSEIITPNRQSGVIGMIKKIKEFAINA